jgi:hypothetical protein
MHGTIAYSPKHVYHIKKILTMNLATIQGLVKMIEEAGPHWSMDKTLKESSNEVATCIRILDTEGVHV